MTDTANTVQLNAALANPRADIASLDDLERRLFAYRYAIDEIASFGPSIDPAKATEERGEAYSLLERERQELLCAAGTGAMLNRLTENSALLDDTRAAQVRVLQRDRASLVDIPSEEQAEFSRLTVEANDVWRRAKAADDWESFEPYVDRIVETKRRFSSYKNADADPYDVWLDEYERGTDRGFYDAFFSQVKSCVIPLLADVQASKHKPSHAVVDGSFDEARQWRVADDLMRLEGVDTDALWMGRTEHPFTGGPGVGFVVIASHVYPDNLLSNVFSMLHEGGHTLYEQNVNPAYRFTSLKGGHLLGHARRPVEVLRELRGPQRSLRSTPPRDLEEALPWPARARDTFPALHGRELRGALPRPLRCRRAHLSAAHRDSLRDRAAALLGRGLGKGRPRPLERTLQELPRPRRPHLLQRLSAGHPLVGR